MVAFDDREELQAPVLNSVTADGVANVISCTEEIVFQKGIGEIPHGQFGGGDVGEHLLAPNVAGNSAGENMGLAAQDEKLLSGLVQCCRFVESYAVETGDLISANDQGVGWSI